MTSKSKRNKRAFFKKVMPFLQSYAVEVAHMESFTKGRLSKEVLKTISFHTNQLLQPLKLDTIYESLLESILRSLAMQAISPNIAKSSSKAIQKVDLFFQEELYLNKMPHDVRCALESFAITAQIRELIHKVEALKKSSNNSDSQTINLAKEIVSTIRSKVKQLDKHYLWKLDDIRPNFLFQLHLIERSLEIGNFEVLPPPQS